MARVLITGASRGLGRSLAIVLSQRGHEVIASARHITDLVDLEATSKRTLDVTSPASIAAALAGIGEVDVVINNAALVVEGPVEAIPVEVLQSMFETNVFGPLRVIKAILPSMRERTGSSLNTFVMHAVNNSLALIVAYVFVSQHIAR